MHRVVYRSTSSRSAREVCALLAKGGLHPHMLDDPDPNPVFLYATKGTYSIRIAVSPDEVPRAEALLRAHERRCAGGVSGAVRDFRRQLLLSLPIAAVGTVILFLLRDREIDEDTGEFVAFVMGNMAWLTIASLVVVSQLTRARRGFKNDKPSSGWRRWVFRILMIQTYSSPFSESHPAGPGRTDSGDSQRDHDTPR